MSRHRVALGLGSNLGDRRQYLIQAAERLRDRAVSDLISAEPVASAPLDCAAGAPAFLNSAAVGTTELSVEALLACCLDIECELGRPRLRGYHADRVIDIDILLFGNLVWRTPGLQVPHPELALRDFVLLPLSRIAGDWPVPPDGRTVAELLDQLQHGPSQ